MVVLSRIASVAQEEEGEGGGMKDKEGGKEGGKRKKKKEEGRREIGREREEEMMKEEREYLENTKTIKDEGDGVYRKIYENGSQYLCTKQSLGYEICKKTPY